MCFITAHKFPFSRTAAGLCFTNPKVLTNSVLPRESWGKSVVCL